MLVDSHIAFELYAREELPRLRRRGKAWLGNDHDAADAVQEFALWVLQKIGQGGKYYSKYLNLRFLTFLRNFRNRARRWVDVTAADIESRLAADFIEFNLIEEESRDELSRRCYECIAMMTDRYRRALELRYGEGLPISRCAEIMELTPGAFNTLSSRARTKLYQHLNKTA